MVVVLREGSGTRLRLLEAIREYSQERQAGTGETEVLRDGHAEYFCEVALDLSEELFRRHQIVEADVSPTRTRTYRGR